MIFLTGFLTAAVQNASAQNGGFAGSALRLGFSPELMAVSNAATANTSGSTYAHYNPAFAVPLAETTQLHLGVSSLKFDRIHQTLGAGFRLPPNAGLAVELIRSGVNDIDGRTASGYPTGSFDTSEYQLLGAFGLQLSDRMKAGVGFKLNYLRLHKELKPSATIGLDFGLLYKISSRLNAGFAVQDLLAEYSFNSAELYGLNQARNIAHKFPVRLKWGLAYQQESFTVSADYELQILSSEINRTETHLVNGIPQAFVTAETITTSGSQLRLGASWAAHERITLRAGYNLPDMAAAASSGYSAGFSIRLPFDTFSPSVNYAFITEPNRVANMHVFALSLHL